MHRGILFPCLKIHALFNPYLVFQKCFVLKSAKKNAAALSWRNFFFSRYNRSNTNKKACDHEGRRGRGRKSKGRGRGVKHEKIKLKGNKTQLGLCLCKRKWNLMAGQQPLLSPHSPRAVHSTKMTPECCPNDSYYFYWFSSFAHSALVFFS